ncbi:MAG: Hpt domain-containing protein [Campylobacterota bacterium]|nr:Hpt domain-containing protein [Campylobacterota bacterium]
MPITNPDYSNLDHEAIAKEIGLKVKHIPILIGSFLEETPELLSSLEKEIGMKNYSSIRASAHSIKGSAANLRFNELSLMAKEIEHAASSEDSLFDYVSYVKAMQKAINSIKI